MGQAKLRGTYEERKAQAIAAGRTKKRTDQKQTKPISLRQLFALMFAATTPDKKTSRPRDVGVRKTTKGRDADKASRPGWSTSR
jgi:hypothetical protein